MINQRNIHESKFNYGEFAIIKPQSTPNQFICLANMESLNAHLINEGFSKSQRIEKLNKIAISQMKILNGEGNNE